jgi:hypothetical protein
MYAGVRTCVWRKELVRLQVSACIFLQSARPIGMLRNPTILRMCNKRTATLRAHTHTQGYRNYLDSKNPFLSCLM